MSFQVLTAEEKLERRRQEEAARAARLRESEERRQMLAAAAAAATVTSSDEASSSDKENAHHILERAQVRFSDLLIFMSIPDPNHVGPDHQMSQGRDAIPLYVFPFRFCRTSATPR